MSTKTSYWICGRKLVLPATPDPIDFSWENASKKKPKQKKKKQTKEPVTPKQKRYRLRKKQK